MNPRLVGTAVAPTRLQDRHASVAPGRYIHSNAIRHPSTPILGSSEVLRQCSMADVATNSSRPWLNRRGKVETSARTPKSRGPGPCRRWLRSARSAKGRQRRSVRLSRSVGQALADSPRCAAVAKQPIGMQPKYLRRGVDGRSVRRRSGTASLGLDQRAFRLALGAPSSSPGPVNSPSGPRIHRQCAGNYGKILASVS